MRHLLLPLRAASALALSLAAAGIGSAQAPQPGDGGAKPAAVKPARPIQPGKDRWLVKTATDAGAIDVKGATVRMTVEKMLALPRPADMPLTGYGEKYQTRRAQPVETTIYTVEADVAEYRLMPDGDYRVVLRGASGKTMVLEMPNPAPEFVSPNSPFAYAIRKAREQFESRFTPETTPKTANAHARITGIGFFGRQYGKAKADGSLIQLHPAVDLEWLDRPSPQFTAARKDAGKTAPPTFQPK